MFNRALSQSEVQNIMSNQTAVAYGVTTGKLPPATPVNLASGATLDLTGTSQTIASLVDIGGNGGAVTNSAGTPATLTLSSANTNTFSGKICDASTGNALSLIKSGSGTQNLNGANNYNGNTTVNGGTLAFSQTTLPTNGIVTVTSGAVLSLNFTGTNRVAGHRAEWRDENSGRLQCRQQRALSRRHRQFADRNSRRHKCNEHHHCVYWRNIDAFVAGRSHRLAFADTDEFAHRRPRHKLGDRREFLRHEPDIRPGFTDERQRLFPADLSLDGEDVFD